MIKFLFLVFLSEIGHNFSKSFPYHSYMIKIIIKIGKKNKIKKNGSDTKNY